MSRLQTNHLRSNNVSLNSVDSRCCVIVPLSSVDNHLTPNTDGLHWLRLLPRTPVLFFEASHWWMYDNSHLGVLKSVECVWALLRSPHFRRKWLSTVSRVSMINLGWFVILITFDVINFAWNGLDYSATHILSGFWSVLLSICESCAAYLDILIKSQASILIRCKSTASTIDKRKTILCFTLIYVLYENNFNEYFGEQDIHKLLSMRLIYYC